MEKDIAEGNIGAVGKYDLDFKGGKLVIVATVGVPVGSASMTVELDSGAVLDALAKAIPGTIDDAIFGVIKAALSA